MINTNNVKKQALAVAAGWEKGSSRRAGFEALLRSAPRAVGRHLGEVMPIFRELLHDPNGLVMVLVMVFRKGFSCDVVLLFCCGGGMGFCLGCAGVTLVCGALSLHDANTG